ncbi:lipopolysaccharide biosynthesis protein [Mucilaginibacter celer]|uniref:Lipopolysaccharide biosynthesis protein n=1 Tax=Mucilaginibacter celer TaxID=2305508 RepID=A0A494VPQ5_9SPHI|nr:lipopolysaccharide biosynthesis protein [Mucilaginibacter celer]AYL95130.1 lipopolysaccharide biosynthesis protein [Mucilaginibacter celer]
MNKASNNDEAITLREFAGRLGDTWKYVKKKWSVILIIAIIGAIAGFAYTFKKTYYTATSSFVLEENSKMGALSQYSGLASLAGINLNSESGLFQGDNILELYKSRTMIEKALLTESEFNGKKQLLIDRYIDFYELRHKWKSKDQIDQIDFKGDPAKFNRTQDSIITDLCDKFNAKVLNVKKLDKKLSIIVVQVTDKDELFAREFNNRLVDMVNNFYVQTKTKKSYQNMVVLQHQADSVRSVLNASIGGVASAADATPNANPQMLTLKVTGQRKQVDVQASSAVYGEVIKNLELAKIALRQDVPLIQIIDKPVLPLSNDHIKKIKGVVLGFFLALFISTSFITLKNLLSPAKLPGQTKRHE